MLQKYLILIMIMATTFPARSQNEEPRKARVVLLNGTVMKGTVDEWIDGDKLKILLDDNSSVVVEIAFDQIISLEFEGENGFFPVPEKKKTPLEVIDPKGQYLMASAGLLFGDEETNFTIGGEGGYRFNDHFALGLGVNYDVYDIVTTVPVLFNARAYLNRKNATPYCFVGGGYGISWINTQMEDWLVSNERINGGLYGQTGIGYQLRGSDLSLAFVLGYKFQHSLLVYDYNYEPWRSSISFPALVEEKRLFRRIFFTVAAIF